MTTIRDIMAELCRIAPLELQMEFDNAGFQIGHADREVQRALLALDLTNTVMLEARERCAQLVITHHPLIFPSLRAIIDTDPVQARALWMIENGIGLISMHTNLDAAEGGVNDVLIRLLGAEPEKALNRDGLGRIGTLPEALSLEAFLTRCRESLHVKGLRYCTGNRTVSRIAVMGGAGAGSLEEAFQNGCDTYVTADVKYHQFQRAQELGLNLIDADHYYTENPVMLMLARRLSERFPETEFLVSERHEACVCFA